MISSLSYVSSLLSLKFSFSFFSVHAISFFLTHIPSTFTFVFPPSHSIYIFSLVPLLFLNPLSFNKSANQDPWSFLFFSFLLYNINHSILCVSIILVRPDLYWYSLLRYVLYHEPAFPSCHSFSPPLLRHFMLTLPFWFMWDEMCSRFHLRIRILSCLPLLCLSSFPLIYPIVLSSFPKTNKL